MYNIIHSTYSDYFIHTYLYELIYWYISVLMCTRKSAHPLAQGVTEGVEAKLPAIPAYNSEVPVNLNV